LEDVDHVEVLKGPQSTLYGASTLGGLIKLVSKKPDLKSFGGDVNLAGTTMTGGSSGYATSGAVNIPLVQDLLAARISAYDREDPGFTANVLTGDKNINTHRAYGGRLDLRYAPTERLDIELGGLVQHFHSVGYDAEFLNPQTLNPIYGVNKYSAFFNPNVSKQLTVFSLTVNYDTGIGTLTNAAGFAHFYANDSHIDFTPSFGPEIAMVAPLLGFPFASPPDTVQGRDITDTKKVTDELRFTSIRINDFIWQLGGYFTHEDISNPQDVFVESYPSGVMLPGPLGTLALQDTSSTYREFAGFGDLTYYLTNALDATAGIRYDGNRLQYTETVSGTVEQ
ncbi:MAG: hypothetical protein ACREU6_02070, partial [Steroidobacteraceae bacterium]